MRQFELFRSLRIETLEDRVVFAGSLDAALSISQLAIPQAEGIPHEVMVANTAANNHANSTAANSESQTILHMMATALGTPSSATAQHDLRSLLTHSPDGTGNLVDGGKTMHSTAPPQATSPQAIDFSLLLSENIRNTSTPQPSAPQESFSTLAPRPEVKLVRAKPMENMFGILTTSNSVAVDAQPRWEYAEAMRARSELPEAFGERPVKMLAWNNSITPRVANQPETENPSDDYLLDVERQVIFASGVLDFTASNDLAGKPTHPWSLLFGVAPSASPFSGGNDDESLALVRRAVLDVVAESEKSELKASEPSSNYSSNGWKATGSLLAAAFAVLIYHKKKLQDLESPQIHLKRKPSSSSGRESC